MSTGQKPRPLGRGEVTPTEQTYAAFQLAFDVMNAELFGGELPPCLITLQRRDSRCFGYFAPARFGHMSDDRTTDEIALNPLRFKSDGPLEALQTLGHEMCHMWQHHHGKASRRTYHNRQWADKMESIGLMPSSTGKPGGERTGQHMADYAIEGGPFMQLAERLLAGEFELHWYDRAQEVLQATAPAASAESVTGDSEESEPKKRKRVTYLCPHESCDTKVSGKPELHVMCGEHGTTLEAQV